MFSSYRQRLSAYGNSDREYIRNSSIAAKENSFEFTNSYKEVIVNGKKYDARILKDVDDTIKTGNGNYAIEFRDGVFFYPGTYISIKNAFDEYEQWLIADVLDDLFFPKSLIKKCNYLLKWKNKSGQIVERWVAFDDSYKLYDGVRNYGYDSNLPIGSIVLFLPFDEETAAINLDDRFLIDSKYHSNVPDAYSVSNKNTVTKLYNDENGIIKISLTQDQFNHETDNAELMIADYYVISDALPSNPTTSTDALNLEIKYHGNNRIVMGTPFKEYELIFTDENGNVVDELGTWQVNILPEFEGFIHYEVDGNVLRIKSDYNENLSNYKFKIVGFSVDGSISSELHIKVVSGI